MNTRDWALSIGLVASVAGLVGIAISPRIRVWYVIVIVILLVCFSLTLLLIRFINLLKYIRNAWFVKDVSPIIPIHPNDLWEEKIRKEEEYELDRLEFKIKYHDPEGKSVTFTKKQEIIARKKVIEIWDCGLRSDGKIDWTTFYSTLGTAIPSRKKLVASTYEVPTELEEALPLNRVVYREMGFKLLDSFPNKEENLGLWIYYRTKQAVLAVELCDSQEIVSVRGFVTFGSFRAANEIFQPSITKKNEAVWNIDRPQIGEKYVLIWTVKQ